MTGSPSSDYTLPLLGFLGFENAQKETFTLALFIGTTLFVTIASTMYLLKSREKTAMDPTADFEPFELIEKESLSHDTRKFTFKLQTPTTRLGLPIGQHISLRFKDANGKNHQRCVLFCLFV